MKHKVRNKISYKFLTEFFGDVEENISQFMIDIQDCNLTTNEIKNTPYGDLLKHFLKNNIDINDLKSYINEVFNIIIVLPIDGGYSANLKVVLKYDPVQGITIFSNIFEIHFLTINKDGDYVSGEVSQILIKDDESNEDLKKYTIEQIVELLQTNLL